MDKEVKLSDTQKNVIQKLRDGENLFYNGITTGAKWCIVERDYYKWGNIHGGNINVLRNYKLIDNGVNINFAVKKFSLTELGKTIKL